MYMYMCNGSESKYIVWLNNSGFQLDLQLQDEMGGDLSSFVTNGEWELLGKLFN